MSWSRNGAACLAGAVAVVVLASLLLVPTDLLNSLLTGWLFFIGRVAPQVQFHSGGVAVFAVSFAISVACAHYLLSWGISQANAKRPAHALIQWRLKSSIAIVILCMLLFIVGIATTGIAHQIGWLVTSPEPIFISKTQTPHDSELSTYRPNTVEPDERQNWLYHIRAYANYEIPEIDPSLPWNSSNNADAFRTVMPDAICPSQGNPIWSPDGFGLAHNAANPAVFAVTPPHRFKDFDSLGETIVLGEVNAAFVPWADPDNVRSFQLGIRKNWENSERGQVGYGSTHLSGANMLMGDGSIRFIDDHIDARVLEQLGKAKK
tara:strand:+ start:427 stop:1386 length:960 start_codon:yes stop_codon:yes gene_type:complete